MTDIKIELISILGPDKVVEPEIAGARSPMWQTHQPFNAKCLVVPTATADVAATLQLCHRRKQSVVPYGGLTNLVQGCRTSSDDIVLSFERMKTIESVDDVEQTMSVQAGATMREVQVAAANAGLFFPVDIGARDACQVGGFVAMNAGGTKVIRYGMTRDSVLGLEAVLADGRIISSMNRYIKNNSGFDLKQLFVGSEGQLGVITRVVFRLSPLTRSHNVALLACRRYAQATSVLTSVRRALGESLCGFEIMWDGFFKRATQPLGPHASPFSDQWPLYVLVEAMGTRPDSDDEHFLQTMVGLLEQTTIEDAVVAKSAKERDALWAIRGEVEWLVSSAQNFDVSLRTADVEPYLADVDAALHKSFPDAEIAAFGHLGDNNLHLSVIANGVADTTSEVERCVYSSLVPYSGAISAEHGIGIEKKPYLSVSRGSEEIALMRELKQLFDPHNILNPGKVFDLR